MTKRTRRQKLHEGKAKILFEGPYEGTVVQHFKDDVTAFNNEKRDQITGKGVLNNRISSYIMTMLTEAGVPNHFIKPLNMREQLVQEVDIIPLEVVVRNIAAGQLAKRFNLQVGTVLPRPIIEFYFKDDSVGDPFISESHILALGIVEDYELDEIKEKAFRVNDVLRGLFYGIGVRLLDFKLEFGKFEDENEDEQIVVADEISPDTCRLWDLETNEKLDKDRFRQSLDKPEKGYQEIAKRLGVFVVLENDDESSCAG